MPDGLKISQSASPATRAGAGDISERELSKERLNLTPPARIQRAHPKKQLFSTPVNKFTGKRTTPSSNLMRIRSCLDEYQTPSRPIKIGPKAVSMEDLTPTKRVKREKKQEPQRMLKAPVLHGIAEERAAERIGVFMLVAAWRRRREEIRFVRKTLEFQVCCSERLRIQVSALKSLLDSDNAKVRLAMRELERLKQLLKDRELEKTVLEKEKHALELDVSASEDRASELSVGWRDCRAELEQARAALASAGGARAAERARADRACDRITVLENEIIKCEAMLSESEALVTSLRNDINIRQKQLDQTREALDLEKDARSRSALEYAALSARASLSAARASALDAELQRARAARASAEHELARTREQLDWWPRPLTRMLGAARHWLRRPVSLSEAMLWTLIPARHGC